MVTIMGWELQNPFMMWCWRKPKALLKNLNFWLFIDDVSTIDHQILDICACVCCGGMEKMLSFLIHC
jgi:hypothetical protein